MHSICLVIITSGHDFWIVYNNFLITVKYVWNLKLPSIPIQGSESKPSWTSDIVFFDEHYYKCFEWT